MLFLRCFALFKKLAQIFMFKYDDHNLLSGAKIVIIFYFHNFVKIKK